MSLHCPYVRYPVSLGCMRSCRTRRHGLMSVLNMICGIEWTVKNCNSFHCVPNTHTTLSPVTDLWFHIDSEQYDCQFIPTFECKWLHLHLLPSQFHQLQRINSCFITIQQASYVKRHELKRSEHRQSRAQCLECYCGRV